MKKRTGWMKGLIAGVVLCGSSTVCYAHNYTTIERSEPGCTQEGYVKYSCDDCNAVYQESIAPAGHNYTVSNLKASCEQEGTAVYTCSRCNESYRVITAQKLGHEYEVQQIKMPSDTESGVNRYTCTKCGSSYEEEIPALGHDFSVTEEPASCEQEGLRKYRCKRCNFTYTEVLSERLEHQFLEEIIREASDDEDGKIRRICKLCGTEEEETVPALGHEYEVKEIPADCTHEGIREFVCRRCNSSYSEGSGTKLGHSFRIKYITEAGRNQAGYKIYECDRCKEQYKVELPALKSRESEKVSNTDVKRENVRHSQSIDLEKIIYGIVSFTDILLLTAVISDVRLIRWYSAKVKEKRGGGK